MFQDTLPLALSVDGEAPPLQPFLVDDPREAERLLCELRDTASPVNISAPAGDAVRTTLWTLDSTQRRLSFAAGHLQPQLETLVCADEATAVAYLDNVKLQFDLHELVLVHGAKTSALQAAWPQALYRFQRRDSFRVRMPERQGPIARLRHPSMPEMVLQLRIVDLSIGGCALSLPADVPPLQPGSQLAGVRIELDLGTAFVSALQLQHVSSIQPGSAPVRLGCCWVDLDAARERTLQRFIDQTQKRQRLLTPNAP